MSPSDDIANSDLPDTLNFDDFCELLMPLGALNSPAELHGLLCGKLCGGMNLSREQWLNDAWDLLDAAVQPDGQAQDYVAALYEITTAQLSSGEYDLQPFLPDDDGELEERTQALSQWCHGFLGGFGSAGIDPKAEFSGDQAESLRDIAAIVQVTADEEDRDSEQQEADFLELMEYVRIIAMNFYEDKLQSPEQTSAKKDSTSTASPSQRVH